MITIQTNLSKHLIAIIIAILQVSPLLFVAIYYNIGITDLSSKILYAGIIFCATPALIIHLDYYLEDRHKKVTISKNNISIDRRGKVFTYPLENLTKVTVVGSKSIEGFARIFFATEPYYYAELEFTDGIKLHVTCLLFGDYINVQKALPRKYIWRIYDKFSLLPTYKY
ncbi:hypothetical protein [Spirosoma endophyticum]|uniref:PH domain-containing protein n=1 Tax=Spirosoma endophyticum TaxID=662367 RepID=A0A1I2HP46_9BACT|nr:hypothetical protein [Spirosoma endophyticum]SFF31298.1 hypothetical protein SAMN05216167_14610 [Spirosoma endophyticum]